MAEMDERGQEPVDELQSMLSTGTHGPLPRPRDKPGLVLLVPQRAYLSDDFCDHLS
ncbi:hypothetical protein [Streptomyces kronopolitis]|uniref:hypothetical protein n=1 Tax=Streptomyces kronopolitis TaxID=1612435 RepID=UPI003691AB50